MEPVVYRVLFVCSTLAEPIFLETVKRSGLLHQWHAETAGVGAWHKGCYANDTRLAVHHNKDDSDKFFQRPVVESDFERFDFVFGMDTPIVQVLYEMRPEGSKTKVMLLGSFDPENKITIRDPFYDPVVVHLNKTFEHCMRSCKRFLKSWTQ